MLKKSFSLLALALLPYGMLHAASKTLNLVVEGTIEPPPEWRNDRNAIISQLSFSFAGLIAGTDPNSDVNSAVASAKLVTNVYPASVALIRPQGCSIGGNRVEDGNVQLVMNGNAIRGNSNLSIPSSGLQSFQIRFAGAGKHGTQSGAVACNSNGVLTYTY